MSEDTNPKVGVIMGSQSDWDVMKNACDILEDLGVISKRRLSQHIELLIAYMNMQNQQSRVALKLL